MSVFCLLSLFIVSLATEQTDGTGSPVPMTDELKQMFLDIQNDYRRGERATNMNKLAWNASVAKVTADWLTHCDFEHMRKDWGENLYYETMSKDNEESIQHAIKGWFDEKFLPEKPGSCGERCHYTQVVWAESTQVGCAIEKCDPLQAFGSPVEDATYIGCFYWPRGNMIEQKPYETLGETSEKCDDCQPGTHCEDRLCVADTDEADASHDDHDNNAHVDDGGNDVNIAQGDDPGPPEDEGEEDANVCKDELDDCAHWKSWGLCDTRKEYMEIMCAKTCAFCSDGSPTTPEPCKDYEDNCPGWAEAGTCDTDSEFMKYRCRKSCKHC